MALLLAALALTAASTGDVDCPPDAGAMGAAELRQWLRSVGVAEQSVALAAENAMDGASMGAASQEALVSVLRLPLGTAALIHRCFQPPAASTAPPQPKNFGYGLSQGHIHVAQEETLRVQREQSRVDGRVDALVDYGGRLYVRQRHHALLGARRRHCEQPAPPHPTRPPFHHRYGFAVCRAQMALGIPSSTS